MFSNKVLLSFIALFLFSLSFRESTSYFEKRSSQQSGLSFINTIPPVEDNYNYASNGNGIGVADFNNDGLVDIFFSSNNSTNKLYLNKGEFRFEDISTAANIEGNGFWGAGVSVVDINADGWMDVYVSHSGLYKEADKLVNQLFINKGLRNGQPYFEEEAAQWGLALPGTHTTQTTFFDYDKDGDLDAFVLNHSTKNYVKIQSAALFHAEKDTTSSNLLLKNIGGSFINVTEEAGLVFSSVNFGLGVVVTDLNNDGWEDIYCTSDFEERDFCYLNQKNGTFKEVLEKSFQHVSFYSMGVDAGDINNDSRMDLVTLDMLPETNERQKLILANESLDKQLTLQKNGFYYQYVRNMLQVNQGIDQNGLMHFAEVGQLAGISNTDWSWSPLYLDFDNDGKKDLFVTSGYAKDYANMDVLNDYTRTIQPVQNDKDKYPELKLAPKLFRNEGGVRFADVSKIGGFTEGHVSTSCVYADFDNDGRVDLLYSNLNAPPSLYRNRSTTNNYLKLSLKHAGHNKNAIGAKVIVKTTDGSQVQEVQPVRGYQSSQDIRLNFGLQKAEAADVEVIWPDGKRSEWKKLKANQHLTLSSEAAKAAVPASSSSYVYRLASGNAFDSFSHIENKYIDFKHQYTVPYILSRVGPAVAQADINGDGYPDFYQGGAKGYAGQLLLSKTASTFTKQTPESFIADKDFEDVAAVFIDIEKDGDYDLYVASGGTDYPAGSSYYQDRLYLNDGKGKFLKLKTGLPDLTASSKGVVTPLDYDRDGDEDLFIGGYTVPGHFGMFPRSFLLKNESTKDSIAFKDVTDGVGGDLKYAGMITGVQTADWNGDGHVELFVSAEWTNCKLFINRNGKSFHDYSQEAGLLGQNGLWSALKVLDIDQDGDLDMIVGNAGINNQFQVSASSPMRTYMADLNRTGKPSSIVSYYINGKEYPLYFRDEFLEEAFAFKQKYPTFTQYAKADIQSLFQGTSSPPFAAMEINNLQSGVFVNEQNKYHFVPFDNTVQTSRVNVIEAWDSNKDGLPDLLLAGNFYGNRTRFGRSDALPPLLLQNKGKLQYTYMGPDKTGLFLWQQTKSAALLNGGRQLLFFNNNSTPVLYEKN